ncbi:MAG: M48 family metalloprotease [Saprospiraceae bacterium]|nr:M48 family metalloprotease [Saprospiraceae bacterium]
MRMLKGILYLALITLMLHSCSRNPVTGKKELMFMSEGQEIALGKESDPQIVAAYGLYPDDEIQAFINEKGKEMAAISHRPELDYQFRVLDSPVVNAFAVPGGYVYFTRGILAHFNNEAEFAGVLGHEIGHITARHSAKQYSKQMLGQLIFIGGMIASEDFRNYADVAGTGMQLLFLKFGRDDESQSDMLGVEYSSQVGYNAHEMADFFNTLQRMSQQAGAGSIPTFMSTHPDPGDRNKTVHQLAEEWQSTNPAQNLAVNRESYLRMIDGIVYGEDPRQGFVENDYFYHPELKFQFPVPRGWRTQNSPSQFQMAPEDGKALMVLTLAQGNSPQDAANQMVQENELTVIESSNVRVHGNNAFAMISEVTPQSTNGQATEPLRLMTYFIQYGQYIYKLNGMSRKTDFNNYFSTFQYSMKNFRALTDPAKLNKAPTRIKIVTADRTSTLQELMSRNGMPQDKMNELSLINGIELNETVQQGALIKTLVESLQ